MANTINSGTRYRLPYYATTGTDLSSSVYLYYSPTAGTFSVNGTTEVFRGSALDLLKLGHYHSASAGNNTISITRSRGSSTAKTAVQAGDTIGNIAYNAVTNSSGNVVLAGSISALVDTGSVSAGSLNSKLVFSTRRGASEITSLIITSQATSTGIGTGGVQIPQGGLSVDGPIYAGNIFTNGSSVSTFDGNYNNLTNKPTVPTNLDSLTDVSISSPSSGQVLKYNGTTWINDADATGGGSGTTFSDTLKTSKGNLNPEFDFDANGLVELTDATAYQKMTASSKAVSSPPALTRFVWMEGTWASTSTSHGVISCVQGNATNVLKKVVDLPALQTGDTMFIGNVDASQAASSGFYVTGEKTGMFAYDNNGEQADATSTMSIASTTDGSGRWDLRGGHGGVRVYSTLTVTTGGISVTGATGFVRTKSYADTNSRDLAIATPLAGMIVLVGSTFYGYNGSSWVAFN